MTDLAKTAFGETFVSAHARLQRALPELVKLPAGFEFPALEFAASDDPARVADIAPRKDGPPVITIYERFLLELEAELADAGATLRDACLSGVDEPLTRELSRAAVETLLDFTAVFLLSHELHHYIGGHFALLADGSAFAESALGMASQATSPSRDEQDALRRRYYLEHESDSTALQMTMQLVASPALAALSERLVPDVSPDSRAVYEAEDGVERRVAFRLVVAAFWTTLGLLERRTPSSKENVTSHPLPGARLLAGLSTILAQYAELTEVHMTANGLDSKILDESDVDAIRSFLKDVLQPIVLARLASSGVVDREMLARAPELAIVQELGNFFLDRPIQTRAGKELLEIQRLRPRMKALLRGRQGRNPHTNQPR